MDILQIKPKFNFTKNIPPTTMGDGNFSKILKSKIKKKKKKKKKKRCAHGECKKKLKLTDMNCKCNKTFCSLHRLPETHKCSWNHKSIDEMKIYKNKSGLNQDAKFQKFEQI